MDAFGIVVIAVLVVGVVVGALLLRQPVDWSELGGEGPDEHAAGAGGPPSRVDDEADLRALVAGKRAARQAAGEVRVASDTARQDAAERRAGGGEWAHLDPEVVEEARALVARRRARLERRGDPVPDERAELVRLLGPPLG